MTGCIPRGPGLFEVTRANGDSVITNVRRIAGAEREPGSLLVGWSTALLALLDAGLFYVSWWGQYLFIFAARHQEIPSMIQAGMFDTGQEGQQPGREHDEPAPGWPLGSGQPADVGDDPARPSSVAALDREQPRAAHTSVSGSGAVPSGSGGDGQAAAPGPVRWAG